MEEGPYKIIERRATKFSMEEAEISMNNTLISGECESAYIENIKNKIEIVMQWKVYTEPNIIGYSSIYDTSPEIPKKEEPKIDKNITNIIRIIPPTIIDKYIEFMNMVGSYGYRWKNGDPSSAWPISKKIPQLKLIYFNKDEKTLTACTSTTECDTCPDKETTCYSPIHYSHIIDNPKWIESTIDFSVSTIRIENGDLDKIIQWLINRGYYTTNNNVPIQSWQGYGQSSIKHIVITSKGIVPCAKIDSSICICAYRLSCNNITNSKDILLDPCKYFIKEAQ